MHPITRTTVTQSKPLTDAQVGAIVREQNAAKKAFVKASARYCAAQNALNEVLA